MKRLIWCFFILVAALPLAARGATALAARSAVYADPTSTPARRVAVVFGAGVRNGYPTAMLYDRVASAVDLYRAGKVDVLLMSGDRRHETYDEPAAMRRAALQLGVRSEDILIDEAGRSTYDTCLRARSVFVLTEATLVTQRFHLDRALMLCRGMGIDAVGYAADRRPYRSIGWSHFREVPATVNAMIELWVTRPGRANDS